MRRLVVMAWALLASAGASRSLSAEPLTSDVLKGSDQTAIVQGLFTALAGTATTAEVDPCSGFCVPLPGRHQLHIKLKPHPTLYGGLCESQRLEVWLTSPAKAVDEKDKVDGAAPLSVETLSVSNSYFETSRLSDGRTPRPLVDDLALCETSKSSPFEAPSAFEAFRALASIRDMQHQTSRGRLGFEIVCDPVAPCPEAPARLKSALGNTLRSVGQLDWRVGDEWRTGMVLTMGRYGPDGQLRVEFYGGEIRRVTLAGSFPPPVS